LRAARLLASRLVLPVMGALLISAPAAAAEPALEQAKAPAAELDREESLTSLGIDIDRYQQEVDGVPVLGSEVVVADQQGEPAAVVADSTAPAIAAPVEPSVSRAAAIEAARASVRVRRLRAPAEASLAIDPGAASAGRQVWRVTIPSQRPFADYEVLVDAQDGSIVSTRDVLDRVQGSARVFVVNPVTANGGTNGLADDRDRDSDLLTALRTKVTLQHLRKRPTCLNGAFAHGLRGFDKEVCSKARKFGRLTRQDKTFEAVNAYYAVDRTQTYIRSLGFDDIGYKRIPLRTNAIKEDNSGFSFFTRDLIFGTGGVDDAEDPDIVIHEYGHAIQDSQVPQFGSDPEGGAIGEGFGDYMAAVMTAVVPGTSGDAQACIFDWDAVSLGVPCLRRTDSAATVASVKAPPCEGEIHCAGEVWSGALWKLRGELGNDTVGQPVMDKVVLQSNFLLAPDADFKSASEALLVADQQLYGGAHQPQIAAELDARGLR
jgi:hypothetical protein